MEYRYNRYDTDMMQIIIELLKRDIDITDTIPIRYQ
jgi:hypothetical protein